MAVEQFDGKIEVRDTSGTDVRITLNGDSGNITAGHTGADGDLVLRSRDADPANRIHLDADKALISAGGRGQDGHLTLKSGGDNPRDRMRLDAGKGNIWVGGNDADGDIVIFPKDATHREDVAEATMHLDGDTGNINLQGGLVPKGRPARDELLGGYSVDEGASSHFQGSQRYGVIEFTHTHDPARGDREKLMRVLIFNPLLHDNSIVFVTPHTGTPCSHSVGELDRPLSHTPGRGHYIALHMTPTVEPGTRVRMVYWIMN